jgi:hypothetical protein
MIWREKRILLSILGLLLAANTVFFFTYRVQYQSRLDALDTRLEEVENELAQARHAREKAEQTIAGYRKVEADVVEVFDQHWSTQPRRLTLMIGEVKRLATASSLIPPSYSFQRGETERVTSGSRRNETLGASEVGLSFNVQGTYAQVRRLINLLELSRQFMIIESISLAAGEGDVLTLNLHLKTLFRDEPKAGASNRL